MLRKILFNLVELKGQIFIRTFLKRLNKCFHALQFIQFQQIINSENTI